MLTTILNSLTSTHWAILGYAGGVVTVPVAKALWSKAWTSFKAAVAKA